jgi:hypothetical protein
MRALIVVVALVLIFVLIGWITFSKGPDRSSINIESDRIRADTKDAMDSGAKLLHKAGDKVEAEAHRPSENAQTDREPAPITR